MKQINYKSDFDIIVRLRDSSGVPVPFPECDWEAEFWTGIRSNITYHASCRGGIYTNCRRFDGDEAVQVYFENHKFGTGQLKCELHVKLPNGNYSDGVQNLYRPQGLDIELVAGAGDNPMTAEVTAIAPYIKGDAFTYDDFTAEDKKDLIAPIKNSIDKAIAQKQDALTTSDDLTISADNELSLTDMAKKQLFIDVWNEACSYNGEAGYFGRYNEATGFFELNELTDITYAEALKIYRLSYKQPISAAAHIFSGWTSFHGNINCRTYLPIVSAGGYSGPDLTRAYFRNDILETVAFMGGYDRGLGNLANLDRTFDGCTRLRKIIGGIGGNRTTANTFYGCEALEYVDLHHQLNNFTVDLQWSPKLTYDTFDTLVKKSSFSTNDPEHKRTFTLTVHPDVYAKLTGDTTNAAAAALSAEELARWTALPAAAAEKNISFATT